MSASWSSYEPSESGDCVKSVSGYTTKSSDIDGGWPGLNISSSHSQHSEGQPSRLHMHVEPVYDAFVCPLTLQVMREPVTIENGQTFEKDAIKRWFQECKEKGKAPVCPVTGIELNSSVLMPSLALQHIIEEWTSRTEVAQIENARVVLASNSSGDEMLRALLDVCDLCSKNEVNKQRVRSSGLIPFIAEQLKNGENLRCASLASFRILAMGNDDNKVV
ncbi:hypothetical protein L7F22_010013 [Adiantum nelumboides]|nr:hypothetical protein [Adiantum nelumboides]